MRRASIRTGLTAVLAVAVAGMALADPASIRPRPRPIA